MKTNSVFLCPFKATFIISLNFVTILAGSAYASQREPSIDEPLSAQSQRFWQEQRQDVEPVAEPALRAPIRMRTGRSISKEQEEELQQRIYRQAFNQALSRGLPERAQEHVQRFLQYLEEQVSDEVKQCLPDGLVAKLPPFLINTYKFQLSDNPIESSKKLAQLGLGIVNTSLLLSQTEKDNLAGLAFATAGYRALKMEGDIPDANKCDLYLSATQLFVWGSHRYQNPWAKRFMLNKAAEILVKGISSFRDVSDLEESLNLSKGLAKEFLNILDRHQKLAVQEEVEKV